jgi:uncharacterized membrane protein YgcG
MINERDRHIWRPIAAGAGLFCDASPSLFPGLFPAVSPPSAWTRSVTDAMTIFGIAAGLTALLCYVVVRQSQNRRVNRTSIRRQLMVGRYRHDARDSGHHHHGVSADHAGSDHSGPSGDSGSGDGGGGDGGGGDGGGGGSD